MTFSPWQSFSQARFCAGAAALALGAWALVPTGALAQVAIQPAPMARLHAVTPAQAAVPDKVEVLHALAEIESETRLALLLSENALTAAGVEEAEEVYAETWPEEKDVLMAAGVPDLGPLAQALAEAGDVNALRASGRDLMAALAHARAQLGATDADVAASIQVLTLEAAGRISPSGTSSADDYRDAWALFLVARAEADLLMRATDPAITKVAQEIILTLDDALLAMSVPSSDAPVDFDPALLVTAAEKVKALVGSGT